MDRPLDTVETLNALKAWLQKRQLVVRNIDAENSGYDCFFVSLKHGIGKNVIDTLKDEAVVTVGEILAMDIATLRGKVVEYAAAIYNQPNDDDHDVLKVRAASWY